MRISGFTRIDTVTVPDKFMFVISVSNGGWEDTDIGQILEKDKDSIDYLGVASDTDPLCFSDVYKAIKSVRPRGLKVLLITDGRSPSVLDDLIGAGYVHAVDLLVGETITENQLECISIIKDNGCKYAISVTAADHTAESIEEISRKCDGPSMFILRLDRNRPVKKGDLSALTSAAKKCTWNVRTA